MAAGGLGALRGSSGSASVCHSSTFKLHLSRHTLSPRRPPASHPSHHPPSCSIAKSGGTSFAMTEDRVRSYMAQLLNGLAHMHERGWVHRDIKTANLLVTADNVVKIADFGLAKRVEPGRATPRVCTLWYRAPELLFQDPHASFPQDVWSAGCIFGELLSGKVTVCGENEGEQLTAIYKLCGAPDAALWPGLSQLHSYQSLRPKAKYTAQFKSRFGQ